jgi:hypothetical protein
VFCFVNIWVFTFRHYMPVPMTLPCLKIIFPKSFHYCCLIALNLSWFKMMPLQGGPQFSEHNEVISKQSVQYGCCSNNSIYFLAKKCYMKSAVGGRTFSQWKIHWSSQWFFNFFNECTVIRIPETWRQNTFDTSIWQTDIYQLHVVIHHTDSDDGDGDHWNLGF